MSASKTSELKSFRAFSFDIFGTLIDDETGIYNTLLSTPLVQSLPESHPLRTSRTALISEFYKISDGAQQKHPKERHLPIAYKYFSEAIAPGRDEATVEAEAAAFAETPATWAPFPDTVAAMQELAKHYKLVPVTNMDNATFAKVRNGPLAGVHFDAVYTAEDIGSFKPDLRNFEYLFTHLDKDFSIQKSELLHVAQSLSHDHIPANKLKLRNCYVFRGSVSDYRQDKEPEYEWKVNGLGELAALVKQAWQED